MKNFHGLGNRAYYAFAESINIKGNDDKLKKGFTIMSDEELVRILSTWEKASCRVLQGLIL